MDAKLIIRAAALAVPQVLPYLKGSTLCMALDIDPAYKTQDFFLGTITHLVQQVYGGHMGGEFIDVMYSLISGQLYDAYTRAWEDDGNTLPLPNYLDTAYKEAVVNQQDYVQGFYNDIVDARVDGTPIGPLLSRAELWGNQWQSEYNNALLLIQTETGGNLEWQEGDTDDKCDTCLALDGIVAHASTWDELGVRPQGFPNDKLICTGARCGCQLVPTTKRQSPNAYDQIVNAVSR